VRGAISDDRPYRDLTTPESLATGRLVAKQEVLWIFRQDCHQTLFSGVFHSTDHGIMKS
jgi:hypothetical protein